MKKIIVFIGVIASILSVNAQLERAIVINPLLKPFYHGVASGDPTPGSVVIWTRLTPDTGWVGTADVLWRVATDTGMTNIVQSGIFTTDQNRDYTVKVDVAGLQPNTFYFYEFTYWGYNSIRGRTKTAPAGGSDSLRFAVVSCANYEAGYFNAYKVIKERNDVDAIVHLGDYIYEYEHDGYAFNATANRIWEPQNEITVLNDYRTRYSVYRLDEDLMRLHQQFPFFNVWDDHESANDAYKDGADNHTEGAEGLWINRKKYSRQAFFEWLPIREQAPGNDSIIYRVISYGDLVDFIMLDTRIHGRDEQVSATSSAVDDTSRTILGNDQFLWLKQQMLNSDAQWKVLGQQVMIAPLEIFGAPVNADQWDGYAADRLKLMNFVLDSNITDVVALTGDIHTSWANDVPTSSYVSSTGAGSAFVEFVTTSVTSPGLSIPVPASIVQALNPHIKYADLSNKGFTILDINSARTQTDWFFVNTVNTSDAGYTNGESWYVNSGERFLRQAASPSVPRPDVVALQAPLWPRQFGIASVDSQSEWGLMSIYPNPVIDNLYVQLYLPVVANLTLTIADMKGNVLYHSVVGKFDDGLSSLVIPMSTYAPGTYVISFKSELGEKSLRVIKNN